MHDDIYIAFTILLEEIENVINQLKNEVQEALNKGEFEKTKKNIERIERISEFKEKITLLQKEWNDIFVKKPIAGYISQRWNHSIVEIPLGEYVGKKEQKKLKKGLRTPEHEFRIPILDALVELGGKGTVKEVLSKVEEKMKSKLTPYDYESLPSLPHEIRWKNTAQWSRLVLVKQGLLSSNSPKGIWEITPEGIEYLRKYKHNSS